MSNKETELEVASSDGDDEHVEPPNKKIRMTTMECLELENRILKMHNEGRLHVERLERMHEKVKTCVARMRILLEAFEQEILNATVNPSQGPQEGM